MSLLVQKIFEVKARTPMESERAMAAINKLAPYPVAEEDIYIGKALLANDQYDRSHERFPVAYLERFAVTLPGKSVLEGHDKTRVPAGRYFGASVEKDATGVTHLVADYYLPARSDLTARVKMGIASYKSIGFVAAGRTCDLCGDPFEACDHRAGGTYDGKLARLTYSGDIAKVEAMEGSFVWMGCQFGARAIGAKEGAEGGGIIIKSFDDEEDRMTEKEMQDRIAALEAEHATSLAALETRVKSFQEREPLVETGKAYLTDLKAEIGRKLGVLGDDPGPELKLLENADLATLKAWDERLARKVDEKFPPSPVSKQLGNGAAVVPPPDEAARPSRPFDPRASQKGIF